MASTSVSDVCEMLRAPIVLDRPADETTKPMEEGLALCLSGGGYRAMLFHVGVLWRLNDAGLLSKIKRISSVSGGSITAAVLGSRWKSGEFDPNKSATFKSAVVAPIRGLAGHTIDAGAVLGGLLLPGSISDKVAAAYREHLFNDSTLQDLPDAPRFVINATNMQSGALWRFSKPYMADYRVGMVEKPTIPLATAVAASSAFPPILSPVELDLQPKDFKPGSGTDLQADEFMNTVVLSDGGVYDNLGVETIWKRYRTLLVSDAGAALTAEEHPKRDWGRHAVRVLEVIDNQVRSLRKRQIIEALKDPNDVHDGAYWGIRSDMESFPAKSPFACPIVRTTELAATPTRLKALPAALQERLINWGYAVCDVAIRSHVDRGIAPPTSFPCPNNPV